MSSLLYVISDIHGEYEMFKTLLNDFDEKCQQLVLIGDLLDRGARSKECLLLGKKLVEEKNAVYIKGNHEDIFLRFLDDPEDRYPNYILNGGGETIESLLHRGAVAEYSPTEIGMMIKSRYKGLITFLKELPLYYEWYNYLFVHAGINLEKHNWRETSERDFLWIRKEFHEGENKTNKTIVFGHTPVMYLFKDTTTTKLWQQDRKIGIDGGGVYGGSIHGVVFDSQGIVQDIELFNKQAWNPKFEIH